MADTVVADQYLFETADEGPEVGTFSQHPLWPTYVKAVGKELGLGDKPDSKLLSIDSINERATLESLNADSLDRVQVSLAVDELFGVSTLDRHLDPDAPGVKNVGQYFKYLNRLQQQKAELLTLIAPLVAKHTGKNQDAVVPNAKIEDLCGAKVISPELATALTGTVMVRADTHDGKDKYPIGPLAQEGGSSTEGVPIPDNRRGFVTIDMMLDFLMQSIEP